MVIVVDGQADVVVELHLVLGKPWSDEDVLVLFFQPRGSVFSE